jgi:uncharacterized glyoxalase superfamily protein PhnB
MKNAPAGWPRISSALFYREPAKAIDWLCHAFGFEVRLKVEGEGGRIEHSELVYGDGLIMVNGMESHSKEYDPSHRASPRSVRGANTQSLMVYVDDVEAHCARARAAGARIVMEPLTSDYGEDYWTDRTYEAVDLEGHRWWFTQRLRDPKPHAK